MQQQTYQHTIFIHIFLRTSCCWSTLSHLLFVSLTFLANFSALVCSFQLATGATPQKKNFSCAISCAWVHPSIHKGLLFEIWLYFCFRFLHGWVKHGHTLNRLIHSIMLSKPRYFFRRCQLYSTITAWLNAKGSDFYTQPTSLASRAHSPTLRFYDHLIKLY